MASGFNISTFKSRGLTLGGARPALFEVFLRVPDGVGADQSSADKFRFTCSAAQLPAASTASIPVGYFGRKINIAGDRTFTDWSVTIMNDEDFLVRSMFEKWSNSLNRLEANVRDPAYSGNENSYKTDLSVIQYGKDGTAIREYHIIGAFPTSIDAISLNWDSASSIETFGVTFSYDYWLPANESINAYAGQAVTPVST
ncbi:tail tube protein [uncultured Caudovirales phage]|uniref:Tail tube protein n=1 Tax=uncultured Caudovirales phage TaxID=2100421 RepID=A0A6J5QRN9_9CAUD|nr:tail tube protein [uncultured Caudovirales phage]